jgi:Tol biopolymer transport system component/DNA-binding winged helix-turn-helix (wHTH) protein
MGRVHAMAIAAGTNHRVRFKAFELDLRTRELFRNGVRLRVQGQPIDVLEMLLERPGELVTREQLRKKLWPEDTFVDFEHSLNSAVTRLRDALGDRADKARIIETLPRLGYRFIVPVEGLCEEVRSQTLELVAPQAPEDKFPSALPIQVVWATRNRWLLAASISAVALLASVFWYLSLPSPPHVTDFVQITRDGYSKNVMGTDGTRLYVNYLQSNLGIAQVMINGGASSPIQIALRDPWLFDVSPDGSTLLVNGNNSGTPAAVEKGGRTGLWSFLLPRGPLRRLGEGAFLSAAWSPDGRFVVYSTQDGIINLVRSDGTETRRLLVGHQAKELRWSPDGNRICFQEDLRLWEMTKDGAGLHRVLPSAPNTFIQMSGQWTPDGEFFIFLAQDLSSRRPYLTGQQLWAVRENNGGLHWVPSAPVQLTSAPNTWRTPILSREGKKIFAHGVVFRGELVRYDAKSNRLQPYLKGISAEGISFSPDGRSIAYVTFPEGILWRANRDGSEVQQLTEPPMFATQPRWSPDGSQIVFGSCCNLTPDTPTKGYIVSPTGGPLKPLPLPEFIGPYWDFSWSADGSKIVFVTGWAPGHKIRTLDLESGEVTTLPGSDGKTSPRWSPDGRYIAAVEDGLQDLKVFNLKTQRWSETVQKGLTEYPTWSNDGRFIYFLIPEPENDRGVYRIRPSGGRAERIVGLNGFRQTGFTHYWMGFDHWMALDPDETPMLLRDLGEDDIYALTLETK